MNIVGKTVSSLKFENQYEKLEITFADGTKLEIKQIGYEGEFLVTCQGERILSDSQKKDNEEEPGSWTYLVKKEAEGPRREFCPEKLLDKMDLFLCEEFRRSKRPTDS